MGVYIKGMEMPKEGFVEIIVWADGLVQQTGQTYRLDGEDYYTPYIGEVPKEFSATKIPPHGRLIDVDAFEADRRKLYCEDCERRKGKKNGKWTFVYEIGGVACLPCGIEDVLDDLEDAPTVIEAEEVSE